MNFLRKINVPEQKKNPGILKLLPDEPEPNPPSATSQTPKNQGDIAITLGMAFLTVGTVVGSVFINRIKKMRAAAETST